LREAQGKNHEAGSRNFAVRQNICDRVPPPPQKETSESESEKMPRDEGAGVSKRARREAMNWDGTGTAKWADLSRTKGFVPIFWTNDLIWYKSEEEDKKMACFVSKIHSRKGSTQLCLH